MLNLIKNIEAIKSNVKNLIDKRIEEFKVLGKKSSKELFKELCFCILTANSTAERCIYIQNNIGNGFLTLQKQELQKMLKSLGCRFHTKRADYIIESRKYKDSLKKILNSLNEKEAREWLVKNIKGIGYKEASHFLRNIGYKNFAIIDFHIIDILARNKLIVMPKTLTKKRYLEIENKLAKIAEKLNISLAELDLYLWHIETGKILK